MSSDTIVALSSGALPAGIAVVRSSGPHAFAAARRIAGDLPAPRHARLRTLRRPTDGAVIDRALLLCFPGPGSATGEDVVEYHCHGGRATVAALLATLAAEDGCRAAEPGEFTRRALASGILDLTAAEGLADLLEAETELQRVIALRRSEGGVRRTVDSIGADILAVSAAVELAIDYADEEDGEGVNVPKAEIMALSAKIEDLLAQPPIETLRNGVRVVIAGPPNAGKSSLINCLVQSDRAIVTDVPGTTRDVIEIPLAVEGLPIVLVDTAGLRESDDRVEQIGVARAKRELTSADLIVWLGGYDDAPQHAILVAGKSDLGRQQAGLAFSALTGEGRSTLLDAIVARASDILPAPDGSPLTLRERAFFDDAVTALNRALCAPALELVSHELRLAREAIDQISGRAGMENLLDALFSRFCVGK